MVLSALGGVGCGGSGDPRADLLHQLGADLVDVVGLAGVRADGGEDLVLATGELGVASGDDVAATESLHGCSRGTGARRGRAGRPGQVWHRSRQTG